jgi:predicted ester cyclase
MGEPPSGRQVEIPMAAVDEVEGSEITWARLYYDAATAARQLGLESAAARS